MKYVAVEGMSVVYTAGTVTATVTATLGPASGNVKVDGKGVYVDGLRLTATAWTIGAYAGGGTVTAEFESGAEYAKADGSSVLLEGDQAEFEVEATNPSGDTQTFTIKATIAEAGQDKVMAE